MHAQLAPRIATGSDDAAAGTAATPAAAGTTSDQFNDMNSELFTRRLELQQQIAALEAVEPAEGEVSSHTVQLRRLRRQLNDVTTAVVTANVGLVRSYCRRFTSNSSRDDSADFEAAGLLGLMRAIDSFDPSQGRFGHWAFKPIQREVLRAVRGADHQNVSLGDFERRPEILRAYRQLQGDDAEHKPSYKEVAEAVGATVDQVRRVIAPPRFESVHNPRWRQRRRDARRHDRELEPRPGADRDGQHDTVRLEDLRSGCPRSTRAVRARSPFRPRR